MIRMDFRDREQDSTSGKSSEPQRAKVMVSITTPPVVPEQLRSPVDVVLILHVQVRLMAPPNWHRLLGDATQVVVDKLGEHDRLAILPPSLMKQSKPKLFEMSSEYKNNVLEAVKGSQAMRRNAQLVTDLESAETVLYDRQSKEKEERAAHIIVISNSNEDLSSTMISWRFRSVHAFGFGVAHNGRKMGTIASNSESTYAVFDDGAEISHAFAATMDRVTSGVEKLEVRLKCGQDVVLSGICAPRVSYFISNDRKFGIIWANARRAASTVTNFFVDLQFPKLRWSSSKPTNHAAAAAAAAGTQTQQTQLQLSVEAKYGRYPNSKTLKGVCKEVNESMSMEVAAELARMEAVKMVADEITPNSVRGKYDCEQLHRAADRLHRRWKSSLPPSAESHSHPLFCGLDAEIQHMETRLHNNYLWLEYMLSWRSRQQWPLPPLAIAMDTADDPLLRIRVLAKVDAIPEPIRKRRTGRPVLLEVTVPVEGLAKLKRASIDLVLVLDVSCGDSRVTKSKRLLLLNQAMEFILKKLSYKDRLAVIQVESGDCVKLHKPSEVKMDLKLPRARRPIISNANSSGTTKLSKSLADAVELLDGREEDKDRLGLIILISDRDDISIRQRIQRCNYTVHAFGLRGVGNSRTMHHIAMTSSGIYAIIDDHKDKITETFMALIRKITSTIAVNTKVNIICSNTSSVKLSAIESGQFDSSISNCKKFGSIFAGALYAGAVKRFVAYLDNGPGDNDCGDLSSLFQVNVTWQPPHYHASRSSMMETNKLEAQVEIVKEEKDASTNEDVKVKKDASTDEVVKEIVRLKEMEIVSNIILSETMLGEVLAVMVQKLRKDLALLERPKGSIYEFPIDAESLASLANDPDSSQLSYSLSWLSFQGLCEKPPSAPSRTRQESSQQDQENISPEEDYY